MKLVSGWLVGLVVIALAACGVLLYSLGVASGKSAEKANAVKADNARFEAAFEQGRALGTVKEKVVTEYVERVVTVYKAGATITKEVPIYVSKAADASCVVTGGFVRVHDAGAANVPVSGGSRVTDDAGSGIALSAVAATVVDNYTDCHANAEQLTALQAWARGSHSVASGRAANGTQNVSGK
jgi:hypothetical protein